MKSKPSYDISVFASHIIKGQWPPQKVVETEGLHWPYTFSALSSFFKLTTPPPPSPQTNIEETDE